MCVIIYCPAGVAAPSLSELRDAFKRNSNGCGFVTKSIHYHTLHFSAFYRQLKKRDINQDLVIHFRLATQGSIRVKNCHPFYNRGYWFAHNGVLPIADKGDKTDSQIYFDDIVRPLISKFGWASGELKTELLRMAHETGSKFVLMHKGRTRLFGDFIEHEGRYYSNLRHLQLHSYVRWYA